MQVQSASPFHQCKSFWYCTHRFASPWYCILILKCKSKTQVLSASASPFGIALTDLQVHGITKSLIRVKD